MNLSNPIAPQNPTRHYLANNRIKAREHPFTLPFQINLVSEKPKFFTLIIPVSARKSQRPQKKTKKQKPDYQTHKGKKITSFPILSRTRNLLSLLYLSLQGNLKEPKKQKPNYQTHTKKEFPTSTTTSFFFGISLRKSTTMATPIAINKDPNHKNPRLEFPIKPHTNTKSYHSVSHSHSHSPSFLLHNGFNSVDLPDSDIEMITIPSVTYTSLKDLLPPSSSSSSPPSNISPAMMMMINSSWYDEIPIKNPLVKHAALAYLQPMSAPREVRRKGIFGRLKDKCTCCGGGGADGCGGEFFGCFSWINDVVFARVKDMFFWERRRSVVVVEEDYDEEDEDDDDVDEEKVD